MNTRRAQTKDIPRIMELLVQVNKVHHDGRPDLFQLTTKYTDEQLAEIIENEDTPIFVAVDDNDQPMGHGFCIIERYEGERMFSDHITVYIDDICVDENARRQHVGQSIYYAILDYAKEIGAHNITLNVWALNPGAQKFYESFGMKPQKTTLETIL